MSAIFPLVRLFADPFLGGPSAEALFLEALLFFADNLARFLAADVFPAGFFVAAFLVGIFIPGMFMPGMLL